MLSSNTQENQPLIDETVVLIAHNGENCDIKWLWQLTQAPYSPYCMPYRNACSSWILTPGKTKLDSLELGNL